jgi:hypothetical protein
MDCRRSGTSARCLIAKMRKAVISPTAITMNSDALVKDASIPNRSIGMIRLISNCAYHDIARYPDARLKFPVLCSSAGTRHSKPIVTSYSIIATSLLKPRPKAERETSALPRLQSC